MAEGNLHISVCYKLHTFFFFFRKTMAKVPQHSKCKYRISSNKCHIFCHWIWSGAYSRAVFITLWLPVIPHYSDAQSQFASASRLRVTSKWFLKWWSQSPSKHLCMTCGSWVSNWLARDLWVSYESLASYLRVFVKVALCSTVQHTCSYLFYM